MSSLPKVQEIYQLHICLHTPQIHDIDRHQCLKLDNIAINYYQSTFLFLVFVFFFYSFFVFVILFFS